MTIDSKNNLIILTADEGMVFRCKTDGNILTKQLFLGCEDKYENYEEISEELAYETESVALQGNEEEKEEDQAHRI